MPGNPYASAFWASDLEAVCSSRGIEIAHWLFWQKNTTGSSKTPAKFIASWKSPSEVAPSPKYTRTDSSRPRAFEP